jgi:Fe-S-cluster containining protein
MKIEEVCDSKKFGDCLICGGQCCKDCNTIDVTGTDIERISKYLKISTKRFKQRYTRQHHIGTTKRSFKTPCSFLKDNKCSIYPVRPEICETSHSDVLRMRKV